METRYHIGGILIGVTWLAVIGVAFATKDGGAIFVTVIGAVIGTFVIGDRALKK